MSVYPILPGIDRRSFKPLFITEKCSFSNKTLGHCPWFRDAPAAGVRDDDRMPALGDTVLPSIYIVDYHYHVI
jgi:hypothetical protein